jgi:signal transduction histidine kinase
LIDEILALLEVLIEDRHIEVLEQNPEEIREQLFADRSLVRIAFLNVLHNAIKFSPDHSILRILYERVEREGKAYERVCIHDSGPGIAAGEHVRVFERFFSSSIHQIPTQRGAGLGLSIARLVVARSGGQIFFDETAIQGAKCCVELPLSSQVRN